MEKFEKDGYLWRKFSLAEFIDAMELGGVKQAFGALFQFKNGGRTATAAAATSDDIIVQACALGQAFLNLGISDCDVSDRRTLNKVYGLQGDVVNLNDSKYRTIPEIVSFLREKYADQLDVQFMGRVKNYEVIPE